MRKTETLFTECPVETAIKYKLISFSYSGIFEEIRQKIRWFVLVTLGETLEVEYKEIEVRPILEFVIDCKDYESSVESLDLSGIKDSICEVKLTNLTTTQSIDINTSDIKSIFKDAIYVNVKREFKNQDSDTQIDDVESLSLESYFMEHIKENSSVEEFDRLKSKVHELFSRYEEVNNDFE